MNERRRSTTAFIRLATSTAPMGLYQELVHASLHRLDDPAAFRTGGDHNDGKDSPQHPAHMRVGVQDERVHALQSNTHDVPRSPVADDGLFHPFDRPFPRFAAPRRFTLAVESRRFIGHDTINRC